MYELDSPGLEQGPLAGSCEHGNKFSGYIKGGKFLDYLATIIFSWELEILSAVL
jgi:hypothetical protein